MLSQYCQAYRDFQLDYGWFMIFPVLFVMGCMLVAMFVPKAREFPFDNILLLVFVLSFGYIISFTCSVVVEDIPGPTVVIAMGATVGVVLVLTVYAFLCRANFVVYIGIIMVVSVTMLMIGFVVIFTFADVLICIYCGLAVIIYGIYLVIITKMIIGGEFVDFPMDNYIIASILLYIYIVKIFMMILRIVAIAKRN
jgi:FtsH-binding integral membrane protein